MLLTEIFDSLSYGELSDRFMGGSTPGGIASEHYHKLVPSINMGMIEIYKRFNLKNSEIILQLYDEITMYNLHSDYAQSNTASTQPIKYILDGSTVESFTDNIKLITNIYDEIGEEVPLNDLEDDDSVFTPTLTTLQVPFANSENTLSIIYRAMPDKISLTDLDPDTEEVALPPQLLEAMGYYVAARLLSPIGSNESPEGTTLYGKFLASCKLVENLGLVVEDTNINSKFGDNGWV